MFEPAITLESLVTISFVLFTILMSLKLKSKKSLDAWPPGPKGFPLVGVAPLLTSRPDKKIKVSFTTKKIINKTIKLKNV